MDDRDLTLILISITLNTGQLGGVESISPLADGGDHHKRLQQISFKYT